MFARLWSREDGSVALEMAIVSPFLALLMFGIHDFGTLFQNAMEVEHLAQSVASYAVDRVAANGSVPSTIAQEIQSAGTKANSSILSVSVTSTGPWCGCPQLSNGTYSVKQIGSGVCSNGNGCEAAGTYITVTAAAPTQATLGNWIGFPGTVSSDLTVRLQ